MASNFNPVTTIICFVLFSMAVNLAIWNLVYDMQPSNQQNIFMDLDANFTTGDPMLDGIINGMLLLFTIAILSFALLACMLHKLQWIVLFFIKASFAILVYTVPAIIISDIYAKFCSEDEDYVLALVTTIALYSLFVYKAYNTDQLPNILQRTITVLNCSFASVYYLRLLPRHTIWFLLMAVIIWDLFAVKSKFGPLKLARQNAMDYDASILRYLLFTTNGDKPCAKSKEDRSSATTCTDSLTISSTMEEDLSTSFTLEEDLRTTFTAEEDLSTSFTMEEDLSTSFTMEEDLRTTYIDDPPTAISADGSCVTAKAKERKTAYDVLHDPDLTSLGLGDFIIYNMLVGKVAMSGSWLAVLLTITGIIIGLIIALQLSSEEEERDSAYFPALPISLFLGMAFYGAYLALNHILIGTILAYFARQILGMIFYAARLAIHYDFFTFQFTDMLRSIVQVVDMHEGSNVVQVVDMLEGSI